ncbi:hypothetical protein L1049_024538 [Liquidambar formosana]|uniref:DDE Tnp4 domain-containing protein n=1 Tax=Liquidambar formosana TaxID=63359 RepID=A0AAP0S152_LIQFO
MPMLAIDMIRPPNNFDDVPPHIRQNPKYWPYFKDCIGAIDEKYYLVDAGYPNMKGFLAPYKGERYHLSHFHRGSQPRGTQEIFNQAHSSLQSVIERTSGVWKARWGILEHIKFKSMGKQIVIVSATMALHNFIRTEDILDMEFQRFGTNDDYSLDEMNIGDLDNHTRMDDSEMGDIRDRIATELASR